MKVQGPPRLGNWLHCLQHPTLRTSSVAFFSCGVHFGITPFCHSFCFFWYLFFAIPSAFCYSVLLFLLLFFRCCSFFFSFLPFTLKNRKISSCEVRLKLVWDQGNCCRSKCAGRRARVLVWEGFPHQNAKRRSNCSSDTTRPRGDVVFDGGQAWTARRGRTGALTEYICAARSWMKPFVLWDGWLEGGWP